MLLGWLESVSELAEYILGFCSQTPESRAYAETHLGRFVRTVWLTPPGFPADRLLEMGAYMQITPALEKLGYGEVRGCYLGRPGDVQEKRVRSMTGEEFRCTIDGFNAELDPFPYPDEHFRTVLCCELVEHLSEDPMAMMAEINRVLRPGGHLVMSTPNICSLRGVTAVLAGYHPNHYGFYTTRNGGNKVDPRHAREYAPREVHDLFEAAGFDVESMETTSLGLERDEKDDWAIEMLEKYGQPTYLREDITLGRGVKVGPVRDRYPDWLYV